MKVNEEKNLGDFYLKRMNVFVTSTKRKKPAQPHIHTENISITYSFLDAIETGAISNCFNLQALANSLG